MAKVKYRKHLIDYDEDRIRIFDENQSHIATFWGKYSVEKAIQISKDRIDMAIRSRLKNHLLCLKAYIKLGIPIDQREKWEIT